MVFNKQKFVNKFNEFSEEIKQAIDKQSKTKNGTGYLATSEAK